MKKKITLLSCAVIFIISPLSAKDFDFIFFGFTEKSIRVKWEVYQNTPTGFPDANVKTLRTGEGLLTVDLKKGDKIIFEAVSTDNAKRMSLSEFSGWNAVTSKRANPINFTVVEQRDIKDMLSIPQLALKVSEDKYANSLIRERNDIVIDKDLPIGTLIFFDGTHSYYKPTTGIVTEGNSKSLNQYYHKIEDMIRVESSSDFSVQGTQLGFLKSLSVDLAGSNVKFVSFRIEIDNLNKIQAQSYSSDPYDVLLSTTDAWLNAVFSKVNSATDKSKFKLYFVTAKLWADRVVLKRKTYKQFSREIAIGLNIENIIDVAGSGQHYSLASYEKKDSLRNFYVDYEAMDMTLVLQNEAAKRKVGTEIANMQSNKAAILLQVNDSKTRILDTYQLLTQYSTLPQSTSVNQVVAICKGREPEVPMQPEVPVQVSAGGTISASTTTTTTTTTTTATAENTRVIEYNRYLTAVLGEIKIYEERLALLNGIESRILQLQTATGTNDKDTKQTSIESIVLKNLTNGAPN